MTAVRTRTFGALAERFEFRLLLNFAYAIAAYLFVLRFVFPGFVGPLAAFHDDMYIGPNLAALGIPYDAFLSWPRPVIWLIIRLGGQLGFEGSVAFTTAITLLALALALTLVERYLLRRTIPWWLALGTLMLAMTGGNFYFVAGYDIGTSAAIVFGLLGIAIAEAGDPMPKTYVVVLALYVLSALTKESFLPALVVYGVARSLRRPFDARNVAFLGLPFVAGGVALADGQFAHSTFVELGSSATNPYRISLAPASIAACARFYLAPLANWGFALLLLSCAAGIWINGRVRAGIAMATAAFSLYLPYLVLPNHQLAYYQWAPMPLLMLLVPLAWTPNGAMVQTPPAATRQVRRAAQLAILVSLALAIVAFGIGDDSPFGRWSLQEQNYNRAVLAGVRSQAPQLRNARSALVVGVSNVFQPWLEADFLSRDVGFTGTWYLAQRPDDRPIGSQRNARPIAYDAIVWTDYDLVIVFAPDGQLAGTYRGDEIARLARAAGRGNGSNLALVADLARRGVPASDVSSAPPGQPAATNQPLTFPDGLAYAPGRQPGVAGADGVYPSTTPHDPACCWIGPDAVLPVAVRAGTRTLELSVYLPSYSPFEPHGQRVTISAPQAGTSTRLVPLGSSDLIVHFSERAARNEVVTLHVHSAVAIVPAEIGLNGDRRHLALIVRSVRDRP